MSFTKFCDEATRKYQTTHPSSHPFMSCATFVKCILGWICAFKIDFRLEVDPWCKHSPQFLACDGTHVGVSVKYMKVDKPITEPDTPEIVVPSNKRFQRVLLPYPKKSQELKGQAHKILCDRIRETRSFFRYLVRVAIGHDLDEQDVKAQKEDPREQADQLHNVISEVCKEPVQALLLVFLKRVHDGNSLDATVVQALGKVLQLMVGDSALSSVLPIRFHDQLTTTLATLLQGGGDLLLLQVRKFAPEVATLLHAVKGMRSLLIVVCEFFLCLMEQIMSTHLEPRPSVLCSEDEGLYNPTSGTAYYFTEAGKQIRKMPNYEITRQTKVHDDEPTVDKACQKYFPQISFGGFGYLFLFFCPLHGHCYGMHLVSGLGEGRKDPFAALFKYTETPPKEVFYDFACQLQEYILNREPSFFKNTRFWHDLFHGIKHLCGKNFKSSRIRGMEMFNTEICEQFNSYLQCIKFTGSHLSQNHFMLLTQFLICLWNRDKTKMKRKMMEVAMAGRK